MSRPSGALRTAAAGLLFASSVGMFAVEPPTVAPLLGPLVTALLAAAGAALLALGQRGVPWVGWVRVTELVLASLAGVLAFLAVTALGLSVASGLDTVWLAVAVYALVGLAGLSAPTLVFAAVRAVWPGDLTV